MKNPITSFAKKTVLLTLAVCAIQMTGTVAADPVTPTEAQAIAKEAYREALNIVTCNVMRYTTFHDSEFQAQRS